MWKSKPSHRPAVCDVLEPRLAFSFAVPLTPTDGLAWEQASPPVAYNGSIWFTAGRLHGHALYRSNGTTEGTVSTASTLPTLQSAYFTAATKPVVAGGNMFLLVGQKLWVTDGTATGTRQITSAPAIDTRFGPWAMVHDEKVYFTAIAANGVSNVYVSDGTVSGTRSIAAAPNTSTELLLAGFAGDHVYFNRGSGTGAATLMRSNGQTVSTVPGGGGGVTSGGDVQALTPGRVVFVTAGRRVAVSDWTASGTHVVETSATYIGGLGVLNGVAYFFGQATNGSTGVYRTDGTRGGTYEIADSSLSSAYATIGADAERFAGRLYLNTYGGGDGGGVYTISGDGTIRVVATQSVSNPLVADGDRLWVYGVHAYVSASSPTEVIGTDAIVFGPADVSAGGTFVYLANPRSYGGPSLYAWDANSPPMGYVSGTAYNDADGDGEADDKLANATVYADLNANGVFDSGIDVSALTTQNGTYALSPVPVGTWPIAVAARTGEIVPLSPVMATVTTGQETQNVGLLASAGARLLGTVFRDANGNGVRDEGEAGLSGIKVFLSADPSAVTASAVDRYAFTDADGRYLLTDIKSAGAYLRVQSPGPTHRVTQPSFSTDTVPAGTVGVLTGPSIAVSPPGTLRVNFDADVNGDGTLTSSDSISAAFKVPAYVDLDRDGRPDAGEPSGLASDASLLYDVPVGRHVVRFQPPQGWTTSLDDNAVEVDVRSGLVDVPAFTLTPQTPSTPALGGRAAADVDFSGTVTPGDPALPLVLLWDDADANGVRDFAEAYAFTDASGQYAFTALSDGPRRIGFAASGHTQAGGTGPFFTVDVTTNAATRDLSLYAAGRHVRVGGQVRLDANRNGVVDDTDPPLRGAPVIGSGFQTSAVTDDAGRFTAFGSAGVFAPRVAPLPGYTNVINGASISLAIGQTYDGYVLLVSGPSASLGVISGVAFRDTNANGVRDDGEAPMGNTTVWVDTDRNGVRLFSEPSTVTAADGSYAFVALPAGTVDVVITLSSPLTATNAFNDRRSVTLSGADVAGVDFGVADGAPVTGTVFVDYDADGVRGAFDPAAGGRRVWADLNANGVFDAATDPAVFTDAGGAYRINGIAPGLATTLHVDAGSFTVFGGASVSVPGGVAGVTRRVDFAINNGTSVIAGRVFYDANQDGLPNTSAELRGGQTVTLRNPATGATLATATTAADGYFRFNGLAPGSYHVTYELNAFDTGYVVQQGQAGVAVTLAARQVSADTLFSFYNRPMSYTGRVFHDTQRNGHDAADVPLAGVRAFIDRNYNGLFDAGDHAGVTNATGTYVIPNVPYNEFKDGSGYPRDITFENPSGMLAVYPYRFPVSAQINSQTGVADVEDVVYATPAGTFAFGYLYEDLNTNGVRDPGEPGINGRQIATSFETYNFDGVVTDREGYYVYRPLSMPAEPATLKTNLSGAWLSTDGSGGRKTVNFSNGNPRADFGFVSFQIGGNVFDDANANGVRDTGEAPVGGRVVWVDANVNGVLDSGEMSTVSAANGFFSFVGLGAGTFRIAQQTLPGVAGRTLDVTLTAGRARGGLTLGSHTAPAVSAVAIDDGTAQRSRVRTVTLLVDGLIPADRIGAGAFVLRQTSGVVLPYTVNVAGVTALPEGRTRIVLSFAGSGVVGSSLADGWYALTIDGSRITDASGRALDAAGNGVAGSVRTVTFSRLSADIDGNATVNFTDFLRFQSAFGTRAGSSNFLAGLDHNDNGAIDFTDFLHLQSNFGKTLPAPPPPVALASVKAASITGTVFKDHNRDGKYNAGDGAGKAVVVFLDADNDGVLDHGEARTVTDAKGRFSFGGLKAGTFRVRQVVPTGMAADPKPIQVVLTAGQKRSGLTLGNNKK